MALPNIAEIAAASKRRRRERDLLATCYDNLVSVGEVDYTKTPLAPRECWLVAKFGLDKILAAREMVMYIPENLTDAQRKEAFSDAYDAACTLETGFNHLLTKTPPFPLILAPPTRDCYECGRLLVSNHSTKVSGLFPPC